MASVAGTLSGTIKAIALALVAAVALDVYHVWVNAQYLKVAVPAPVEVGAYAMRDVSTSLGRFTLGVGATTTATGGSGFVDVVVMPSRCRWRAWCNEKEMVEARRKADATIAIVVPGARIEERSLTALDFLTGSRWLNLAKTINSLVG
jgi:hypothetical protein